MTNQLSHANPFSDLSNVTLRRVFKTDQGWTIEADGQDSAVCPGYQSVSRSRPSRYRRSLQDLPVQGTPVILRVHVGRWRCRNAGCKRRIFTERPLNVCAPHARQTKQSDEIIAVVGRALGGRPGQRLMGRLGMPLSADTLIRRVKGAARWSALPRVIRVLGVDDWAWCKGQNFGTIPVDLERSQVVDLLPTRSADSFGEWLAQHPEVTTVSLRGGKVTTLHRWMEKARKTGIHSLVRFVRTLKQDLSAVEAAVSKPWSNGPVEGHINRLKMLKRQMYGRADIELLRARLLPEPALMDP
jgi:transposase